MQRKMIAIGRFGDDLAGGLIGIERDREAARALDQLHRIIAPLGGGIEIGPRRLQHLMFGEIGGADEPHSWPDGVAVAVAFAGDKAALFQFA